MTRGINRKGTINALGNDFFERNFIDIYIRNGQFSGGIDIIQIGIAKYQPFGGCGIT